MLDLRMNTKTRRHKRIFAPLDNDKGIHIFLLNIQLHMLLEWMNLFYSTFIVALILLIFISSKS